MTSSDWAATLLADDSDDALSLWADWLEEQGDEACRGVRELLVGQWKRPWAFKMSGDVFSPRWAWHPEVPRFCRATPDVIPSGVHSLLKPDIPNSQIIGGHADWRWYSTHYAALLDASRAYLASLSPLATQPKEKV